MRCVAPAKPYALQVHCLFATLALAGITSAGCHRAVREEPIGAAAFLEEGTASYYSTEFRGRLTASGEVFDPEHLTAAHRTLRFGSCLVVQNLRNGASVKVRVNDRGPYAQDRIVDVSLAAARRLGMLGPGTARVRLYRCDSS